ncbi:MAG: EAL domain-containing protein [Eubacterium sp.]|nr:EAL domain-containing protein [Eubacterium sp.]
MNKNIGKNLPKSVVFTIAIIVSVAAFVGIATFFMMHVYSQLTSVTEEYVEDITGKKTVYVNDLIQQDFNLMEKLADSLNDYQKKDSDYLHEALERIIDINGFLNFAVIKPDGTIISHHGPSANVSNREYFTVSIQGEKFFSVPIYSNSDQTMVNVISVPIYNGEEIVGVVSGLRSVTYYTDEVNLAVRGKVNNANGYIINSSGEIIISGEDVLPDNVISPDTDSFFDSAFMTAAGSKEISRITAEFSKKESHGTIKANINNNVYIAHYTTLSAKDDLHYVIIYDESAVFSDLFGYMGSNIIMYVFFIGVIIVMVLAYFFTMRKNIRSLSNANEIMSKIAYEDRITGYNTYSKFEEEANELMKRGYARYCFVSFDIDKFKTINDMFGHEEGNRVLKVVAETINRNMQDRETFARVNSDNFFMLLAYQDEADITDRIKKIISAISYEFTDFVPVLSFGIYKVIDKNMSIMRMGDCADVARRTVKYTEESSYAFYTAGMMDIIREEKAIENEMQDALDSNEFSVYLQPKFSLSGPARLTGAEALVRWVRKGSIVPPGMFIPIFEKNRFIIKLDYYILDQVCMRIKKWESEGISDILVSVNMSRVHLRDPEFVDKLHNICRSHAVSPNMIEIEITESAAYDSMDVLIDVVRDLKARGFHISIDDFGSGYSSLNMLKDLPVDVLKIDRVFLTETNNKRANEIIGHVIKMARALGMETICEGIETDEQAQLLRSLGCDMAQGFFFARPMPCDDFERVIESSRKSGKA